MSKYLIGALALAALVSSPVLADDLKLSLPIDCKLGKTCFVQNYVDVDDTAGVRDFKCGNATYDKHKGTDFRVLSTFAASRGVRVLAAAPGTVRGVRDSMPDELKRGAADMEKIRGRECGNGIVIDHGNGWETQYCHLRRNSIRVRKGGYVDRGDVIGLVGYSGATEFAHVHLSVRHEGKPIDPFTGFDNLTGCGVASPSGGIWQPDVAKELNYVTGELIEAAFAGAPVKPVDVETGGSAIAPLHAKASALVFYGRFIKLEAGDSIRVKISGPGGFLVDNTTDPLERPMAHNVAYAGKRLTGARWPAGRYEGLVELIRGGGPVESVRSAVELQ